MAQKKFRSWVGFKNEENAKNGASTSLSSLSTTSANSSVNSGNAIERIRELESQLNDLRSRRDITALSREEFEILATETAISLIKTAQQRESRATSTAEKISLDSQRSARATLESAEAKAKSTLAHAESRGRKYISAAEDDASEILSAAEKSGEEILSTKKREAGLAVSQARREAEALITSATTDVGEYRQWLGGVIDEAEKLFKIQMQSLDAADAAIAQSRNRLATAFSRLSELQESVLNAISSDGRPTKTVKPISKTREELESGGTKKKAAQKKIKKKTSLKRR